MNLRISYKISSSFDDHFHFDIPELAWGFIEHNNRSTFVYDTCSKIFRLEGHCVL